MEYLRNFLCILLVSFYCSVALSQPISIVECPDISGSNLVLISDPYECSRFYMCGPNGQPIHMSCPDGLYFNPKLDVCDYPNNVECVTRTTEIISTAKTTEKPNYNMTTTYSPNYNETTTTFPQHNMTTEVHHSNVTTTGPQYNVTTTGPQHNVTTTGPQYNVTTTGPQYNVTTTGPQHNVTTTGPQHNVTTTSPQVNVTTTGPQHNLTTTFAPIRSTTSTPGPEITTVLPLSNTTTSLNSENNTITSSPIISSTVQVTNASSSTSSNTTDSANLAVTAPPTIASQCPPFSPIATPFHLPNPHDCSSFYTCVADNTAFLQHCQTGLHFNAIMQYCDFPHNVVCLQICDFPNNVDC